MMWASLGCCSNFSGVCLPSSPYRLPTSSSTPGIVLLLGWSGRSSGCGALASFLLCAIQTGCPLWPPLQQCSLQVPRFLKFFKQSVRPPGVSQGALFTFFPTSTKKESSQRVGRHLIDIIYFEMQKCAPPLF